MVSPWQDWCCGKIGGALHKRLVLAPNSLVLAIFLGFQPMERIGSDNSTTQLCALQNVVTPQTKNQRPTVVAPRQPQPLHTTTSALVGSFGHLFSTADIARALSLRLAQGYYVELEQVKSIHV